MTEIPVLNVREIDGEPHEVAEQAASEVSVLLDAALDATEQFAWAARGAWMSAEHVRTNEMPDGATFHASAQGRKVMELYESIAAAAKTLETLSIAVSWNPRGGA